MSNQVPSQTAPRKSSWLRRAVVLVFSVLALCVIAFLVYFWRDTTARNSEFAALTEACEGRAVSEAAAYDGSAGIHLVMGFQPAIGTGWTTEDIAIPNEWEATTLAEAELALCFGEEKEELIERCPYGDIDDEDGEVENIVERYQYSKVLQLMEAQTGELIAEETLMGEPPRECLDQEAFRSGEDTLTVKGEGVSNAQIKDWLEPYAHIR